MDKNPQPVPVFKINDLETLRVMADPLRSQIYELLISEPLTVRQVAERLGHAPTRMYYHFSLMEKHKLINVVETRQVANMLEKWYRAAAYDLDVSDDLLSFSSEEGKESMIKMLGNTLDTTREDVARSLQARLFSLEHGATKQPREGVFNRVVYRITDAQAVELSQKIKKLAEEFAAESQQAAAAGSDLQTYALMVAFYPSFYYPDQQKE